MKTICIYRSRVKVIFYAIFSSALSYFFWFFYQITEKWLSLIPLVYFGFFAVLFLLELTIWSDWFARPAIVLNEHGIHFLANPKKSFSINWLDIDRITEKSGRYYHYIVLKMTDREAFLQRYSLLVRCGIALDNRLGLTDGEFYVSLGGMKQMSYRRLLQLMTDYHRYAHRQVIKE